MKRTKQITAGLLIVGLTFSTLTLPQNHVMGKSGTTSAKSKTVKTKRYTISKSAGSYEHSLQVKLTAKKGYKVYYTTSGKFKKKKVVTSGKKICFKLKKTTTLSVYAVKMSSQITAGKMNSSSRKNFKYYRTYKYSIETKSANSEVTATATPDTEASQTMTPAPAGDGRPPEKPDGTMKPDASGTPGGQKPEGTPPGSGGNPPEGGGNPPGGSSGGVTNYNAVKEYTSDTDLSGETISSTGTDENAILISNGANVSVKDSTISRVSSDSTGGDNASFYGVGAAVLAKEGTAYINNSTITTNAAGAAGIFAYNSATAYAANTKITTQKGASGGIHAAGGGTLYAWDMTVETNGQSSAAIRSDRGGGKMVVDGGSYTSNGIGSPAIYSTADIAVANADLQANASEAICIEGLNSIRLFHSNLMGNMGDDSQNDCTWNVILYQSMSGDSQVGNSTFEMNGGTLTAKNGGMFYTTNTESTITLSDVDINYARDNDFFLKCTGNKNQRGWGSTGKNGADCLFTASKQVMQGNILWDSISQLDFYMKDHSTLCGSVKDDETCAGNGGSGYCNMYIEQGSVWTVTGDSTVTKLYCAGTIQDTSGRTVTVKGTDGTVYVQGNSNYTITVNEYQNSADMTGASSTTVWSDYKVEKPSRLD